MKKHLLLAAALCFAFFAQANVIIDEVFPYDETYLDDVESWTTSGTLTTGEKRTILALPLSYSNKGGEYVLSGVGKAVKNEYSAGDKYMATKHFTKQSSGVIYVSYLYQADGNQSQSNSEIFGISNSTSNSTLKAWAGKQSDGTSEPFRLGVTRASTSSGDIQWCNETTVSKNDVVLIVLKYDFSNQAAALFINPEIGTTEEPTPDAEDTDKGTAKSSMEYLTFRHHGSSKANFVISGVRVSTSWAEAVEKKTEEVAIDKIDTDFNDETWGEVSEGAYTSGSYPSGTINDFILSAAGMQSGSTTCVETEEKFVNRISIDKVSSGGMVTFPAVKTCKSLVIYATSGSADRALNVQKYNYASVTWEDLQTLNFADKLCHQFTITVNSKEKTKFRVVNADGSTKYLWKIITNPDDGAPTAMDEINTGVKARKVFVNGQILIERNGEYFDMTGAKLF